MKAIFIYSSLTGNSRFLKHIDYIIDSFKTRFDELKVVKSSTQEELKQTCLTACKGYDYLLFAGGDGTVNAVINYIAKEPKRPILGYIPAGTTNDFAHNFHLSKRVKKAVKVITSGEAIDFDVCKANERYFVYVLATGAFSEISYKAKRKTKKKLGNLAYYMIALRDAFIPQKVTGQLKANGKIYKVNTPVLLILNGNHVGGFYVNLKNKINDGKFSIFITKQGALNGLLHYLFFKVLTTKILTSEFTFTFYSKVEPWCVDGEMGELQNVDVKCLPSHCKILVSKRCAKKLLK